MILLEIDKLLNIFWYNLDMIVFAANDLDIDHLHLGQDPDAAVGTLVQLQVQP